MKIGQPPSNHDYGRANKMTKLVTTFTIELMRSLSHSNIVFWLGSLSVYCFERKRGLSTNFIYYYSYGDTIFHWLIPLHIAHRTFLSSDSFMPVCATIAFALCINFVKNWFLKIMKILYRSIFLSESNEEFVIIVS